MHCLNLPAGNGGIIVVGKIEKEARWSIEKGTTLGLRIPLWKVTRQHFPKVASLKCRAAYEDFKNTSVKHLDECFTEAFLYITDFS